MRKKNYDNCKYVYYVYTIAYMLVWILSVTCYYFSLFKVNKS